MKTTATRALGASFAIALALVAAAPAARAQTVDQQQNSNNGTGHPIDTQEGVGQVFTAGATGALSEITVNVTSCCGYPIEPLIFSLYAVDGNGLPTGSALATQTVPEGTNGDITSVTFAHPYTVTAGTEYAFTLVNGTGNQQVYYAADQEGPTNPYTGGFEIVYPYQFATNWSNLGVANSSPGNPSYADLQFQTFETSATPEPSTWAMFAGGLALVSVRLRRKPRA